MMQLLLDSKKSFQAITCFSELSLSLRMVLNEYTHNFIARCAVAAITCVW